MRYGSLKFTNFWNWIDHILQTTHGIWEFLDFLKMGEQDLQLSCWAKIHLKLLSWCKLRIKKFPFLAVEITGPLSILGNFWFYFKFSHDEVWHYTWGLYRHEWAPSNQFYPSNHWLNPQLTKFDFSVDFSRVLHDWTTSDEFQTLIPWDLDFKWCLKMYEPLIIDHGAQILQEWPPSIALTDCWLSLT